jgi:glycosyltransferase 2 family protein
MRSNPKPGFWSSPAVRIGGSAAVLAALLLCLPFRQVWSAVKRIPPGLALALLCGYLILHLVGVVKWRILINLAGAGLTFAQGIRCYYAGLFANNFLPSLVGGDLVRAGMAFLVSRSKAAVVLGSLIDRMMDVIGLAAVAGIGVVLIPRSLDPQSRRVFWSVAGILLAAGFVGLAFLASLPVRRFPLRIRRLMVKVRKGIRAVYGNPGQVAICLGLGMLLQGCQVAINSWLGEASGLHVAFGIWLFAWPLAKLSALLPVTQGGIGVREAALVGLLAPFGAAPALTAAAGLLFEAVTIVGGLVAGVVAMLIGRISRRQGRSTW